MLTQAQTIPFAMTKRIMTRAILKWAVLGVLTCASLYLIVALYMQHQFAFALLFLVLIASTVAVFGHSRFYNHRYIFPAIAGMGVFVIFPLLYTVGIGFTNYSASNLLTQERVKQHLLDQTYQSATVRYPYKLYAVDGQFRLAISNDQGQHWVTPPFSFKDGAQHLPLAATDSLPQGEPLDFRGILKHRDQLKSLSLTQGQDTRLSMASLRTFAEINKLYQPRPDGALVNTKTSTVYHPNQDTGFYTSADGATLTPGWTVTIGLGNFMRVLTDSSITGPFMQIFSWTITFALLTVVFTLALGLVLANFLQWDQLRAKGFYRTMLILPYAVPAFISILVFKGLFNQNFGEINLVLQHLFGVRPEWFSDPFLAKTMILIVNTWLGYPYMMLLSMGLLQSIPRDLYEASAMDGAGPIDNFFRITLPLIIKPLMPLLIASFAFNFNNFVLIALLTNGAPDIIGASTPAGTTDLLVSYTYRIAFQDSGQDFGLAAAIATVIFILVGTLSLINLKLSKVKV